MKTAIKINLIVLLCISITLACGQKQSKQFHLPKPKGWVNDYEHIYTNTEKHTLDSIIGQYKKQTGTEIAIVTIDSSVVTKIKFDELVYRTANEWGVGEKGKNNGILIGISRGNRIMRIVTGYGIQEKLSDSVTKQVIEDVFIPAFKQSEYYSGTINGLTKIIELLDKHELIH